MPVSICSGMRCLISNKPPFYDALAHIQQIHPFQDGYLLPDRYFVDHLQVCLTHLRTARLIYLIKPHGSELTHFNITDEGLALLT